MPPSNPRVVTLALALLASACGSDREQKAGSRRGAAPTPLGPAEIAPLLPPRVSGAPQRAAWAEAIYNGLRANEVPTDRANACAVIAIIGQESGFQADPAVPGLAALVKARLERHQAKLGPLGKPIFRKLLSGRSPDDPRTFEARLEKVRTERDVDVIFRDLLAYYEASYPATFDAVKLAGKLFDTGDLAALNPITTAGSMQVSVQFAERWAEAKKGHPGKVRDALYTRQGGVYYGTARLFGHEAAYPEPIFRFADYNAGVYASRNAAVQAQVGRLVGRKLALDGDLLAYDKDGEPNDEETETLAALLLFRAQHAPDLSERRVRNDARKEKTRAFEKTDTYRAIKKAFAAKFGTQPRYATMPQVEIESPKLSSKRSTAWFAQSVQRRFEACLATHAP